VNRFNRADVLRILHITPKQLSGWQRAGLVSDADAFTFFDLIQLKKVRELRADKVRPSAIRQSLEAMQRQVSGMDNPLLEATAHACGSRVTFRHQGRTVDPIDGQFMMDFDESGTVLTATARNVKPIMQIRTAAELFQRGVALEDDPTTQKEALAIYRRVLEIDPHFAAAHINLGTLYYSSGDYISSEAHYRKAIECDPRYALAYFDLGNVFDETNRLAEAIAAYSTALQLAPTYGDAHYNLAIAYEKMKQPRKALKHWRSYVKLDGTGPWTVHAKSQIRKIAAAENLKIVYRRPPSKNSE
jgi:tetratricopeptide (TPR) repeat protein